MDEHITEMQAISNITYLEGCYKELPELTILTPEDWKDRKSRLEQSLRIVNDNSLKQKGQEILQAFNKHFQ